MIFIVEGIDRVGKTTLCNLLKSEFGLPIFKDEFRYGNYDCAHEKANTFLNLIENGIVKDVIVDRFHWSEFVYGKINRGVEDSKVCLDIENRLKQVGNSQVVMMIYVRPENIEQSIKEHGSDLHKHNELFKKLYKESELPKCLVTYSDILSGKAIEIIVGGMYEKYTNSANN